MRLLNELLVGMMSFLFGLDGLIGFLGSSSCERQVPFLIVCLPPFVTLAHSFCKRCSLSPSFGLSTCSWFIFSSSSSTCILHDFAFCTLSFSLHILSCSSNDFPSSLLSGGIQGLSSCVSLASAGTCNLGQSVLKWPFCLQIAHIGVRSCPWCFILILFPLTYNVVGRGLYSSVKLTDLIPLKIYITMIFQIYMS